MRPYQGQTPSGVATYTQQEARGGNVTTDTCSCGAVRVSLHNGAHVARGRWAAS